jgi:ABC-type multidrug transport system fused ATPase/permease subunit
MPPCPTKSPMRIATKATRILQYGRKVLKLIGRKGSLWIGVNVVSGVVLGGLEISLSVLLALLLKSLHITEGSPSLPFGLTALRISAVGFLGLLILVGVSRGFFQLLAGHSANVATEMIGARLRAVLLHETFRLRAGFASLSEVNTKSSDIFPKAAEFCYYGASALPVVIQSTILFCALLTRSVRETALGISGILVAGVLVQLLVRRVRRLAGQLPAVRTQYQRRLVRSVKNWFLLKALRTMPQEHDGLIRSLLTGASMTIRTNLLATIAGVLPQVLGTFVLAGLIGVHMAFPVESGVEFFSFLYIYVRLVQNLGAIANSVGLLNADYPHFRISARYFFSFSPEVIAAALSPTARLSPLGANWRQFQDPPRVQRQGPLPDLRPPPIRFQNVGFSYESGSTAILSGLNAEVEAGGQLAIVGPSGSGKSTLLALALGVLQPTEGEITIDGVSPTQFSGRPNVRIAYVGAEPFLIDGTVRENLLYGRSESFTDSEMIAALRAARLEDWFEETEGALDYRISENSEGLSAGQKQRLSLARALLSRPNLLILDEVSANLDSKTEAEVAKTVAGLIGTCTTLIVSHREGILGHVKNRLDLGRLNLARADAGMGT